MKKNILIGIFACLASTHVFAQLALDDQNIQKAKRAVDITHTCDDAFRYLRLVTDSGKTKQAYLLTIAKANDCKSNKEQAIYYYNKFLEKNPENDSVKKRVAELNDMKTQQGAVTKQEKQAKEFYKGAKKDFDRPCVNEKDFIWGLGCSIFTGGTDYPYKLSYSFYNLREYPFAKDRLLFGFYSDLAYTTGGQSNWFARVFNTTEADVTKVPGTMQAGIELSLSAMAVNKHKFAVSVGPILGITLFLMPGIDMASGMSNTYSHPIMFSPVTGLKSTLYVGKHFYTSVDYSIFLKSSYSNDLQTMTTDTKISGNSIRISIGVRGYGFPRYHHR